RDVVGRLPAVLESIGSDRAHRLNGPMLLRHDIAVDVDRHRPRRQQRERRRHCKRQRDHGPWGRITPLDASSCIACMARIVCPIRGIEKTKCDLYGTISGTMVPPSPRLPAPYGWRWAWACNYDHYYWANPDRFENEPGPARIFRSKAAVPFPTPKRYAAGTTHSNSWRQSHPDPTWSLVCLPAH